MIVLLAPPFFRFAGSHNDRIPMELAYASEYLADFKIEHKVINADYVGSSSYIPWSELYHNFDGYKDGVDGRSPLYSEILEKVMQYRPELVVISSGDALMPDVDTMNYRIAGNFAAMFRRHGVKTLGIGKFVVARPDLFAKDYDSVITGPAMYGFVDAVNKTLAGQHGRHFTQLSGTLQCQPRLDDLVTGGIDDHVYVFSSFGCPYQCDFCYRHKIYTGRHAMVPPEVFAKDVASRTHKKLTIRDGTIAIDANRINALADGLEAAGVTDRRFGADIRADLITPEILDAFKRMGVYRLKMGLETLDDEALLKMNKLEDSETIKKKMYAVKEAGFELLVYMIIGAGYADKAAWKKTTTFLRELKPDGIVINTAAYLDFEDTLAKYDNHWSPVSARRYGVDQGLLWELLALEDEFSNPTIEVIK